MVVFSLLIPMSPTLCAPFHRDGWLHEAKLDGWCMVAYKDASRVRLIDGVGTTLKPGLYFSSLFVLQLLVQRIEDRRHNARSQSEPAEGQALALGRVRFDTATQPA